MVVQARDPDARHVAETLRIHSSFVYKIPAKEVTHAEHITRLLKELQQLAVTRQLPLGRAIAFVVTAWKREADGSYAIQFSPLIADEIRRLPFVGVELLQTVKDQLATSSIFEKRFVGKMDGPRLQ